MAVNTSNDELENERKKLLLLLEDSMKHGIPLKENKALLEQSQKVDLLILDAPIVKHHKIKHDVNHYRKQP